VTIDTREVQYQHAAVVLEDVLAFEKDWTTSRPRSTRIPWHGRPQRSQIEFAKNLAEWGYVGFTVDLYGKGVVGKTSDECQRPMMTFVQNRIMLQDRLLHVVEVVKGPREAESDRIAAIGFCFGGLCALDPARMGLDVRGVASFHGVLSQPGNTAGNKITAKVIVFHGWGDPFAPPENLVALGHELSVGDADWQIHAYGKIMHAFMGARRE